MDKELLSKLKKADIYLIAYAIEIASVHLQRFLKRNLDLTKIKKIISQTAKSEI